MPDIVPAETRITNYEDTMSGERLPDNCTDRKSLMVSQYSDYVDIIVPLEISVKAMLNEQHVPNLLHFWYMAALRNIWKGYIVGGIDSATLKCADWALRGLDSGILDNIKDLITG